MKSLVISIIIAISSVTFVYAAKSNFKDVSEKHWAIDYINYVYEKGLIVGDTAGYFRPNDLLDKFQASKILARIVGYKYTNLTASEQKYISTALEKNKAFLKQYDDKFTKWVTNADKEISYLLEKEIYTPDDLNQFVIVRTDGKESLRALSKEEAAVFIVKTLGKKEIALSSTYDFKFADDKDMNIAYKPYIYYLKDKGVFTPDKENKFYPKQGVSRAIMATILTKALTLQESTDLNEETTPLGVPEDINIYTDNSTPDVTKIFSMSGTIDKYYEQLDAIQIINKSNNQKELYTLDSDLKIYVDGYLKTIKDLKQGMSFDAVVKNSKIIEIKAYLVSSTTKTDTANNVKTSVISGVVKEISADSIGIQVNITNSKGDSISEIRKYIVDKNCKFTRSGKNIKFSDVVLGDMVEAEVSTTSIYSLKLYDKNLSLEATLVEKKLDIITELPILVVVDKNNNEYSLTVTADSVLTRKGVGEVNYEGLRVGDKLEIKTEYNEIIDLYAVGEKSTVRGTLQNLYISKTNTKATLLVDNKEMSYNVVGTVDVYSLRIGSVIEAELDSSEICSIKVISQPSNDRITASIISKSDKILNIRDNNAGVLREIAYDSSTTIIDSYSGEKLSASNLGVNMQVYIILENSNSNRAKTITVLD